MAFEDLNINNSEWEVFHNSEGLLVPIMDDYPSPENTFDVWSGVDDGKAPATTPPADNTKQGIDPNALAGALTTVATVGSQLYANRDTSKRELKNVCGRKPFCIGKGSCRDRKNKYEECKKEFYTGSGGFKSGGTQMQQQMPVYTPPPQPQGMSTTAKVGIALGIIALGVGGYFLYKRSKG